MKKLTETPFDLIPVTIAGEKLYPRPVDFKYDEKTGEASEAAKYHSTCPKCSQLIEFTPETVYQKADDFSQTPELYVSGCRDCPLPKGCVPALDTARRSDEELIARISRAPENRIFTIPTAAEIEENLEQLGVPLVARADGLAFHDPIADGVMALSGAERVDV